MTYQVNKTDLNQAPESNEVAAPVQGEVEREGRPELVAVWILIEQLAAILAKLGDFDLTLLQVSQAFMEKGNRIADTMHTDSRELESIMNRQRTVNQYVMPMLTLTTVLLSVPAMKSMAVGKLAEFNGTGMMLEGAKMCSKAAMGTTKIVESVTVAEMANLEAIVKTRKQDLHFSTSSSDALFKEMSQNFKIEKEMGQLLGQLIQSMREAQRLDRAV